MHPMAKYTYFVLAVIFGLTAIAAGQSVENKGGRVDVTTLSQEAQIEHFREMRASVADDPFRPIYHFSPPGYGLHDVAGLCWWQGKYHLFYLITVPAVQWGRGHAVSYDLVHWRDLPMLPKEIWGGTGQAWADKDRVFLTTGSVNIASDPMLLNWTEHYRGRFGDNCVWREGDYYYLTMRGSKNTSLEIRRSKDLTEWESYFTDPGTDCACPNVVPIGNGKHLVLFFSHNRGPQYYIGTSNVEQGRFTIEKHGRMNYGQVMRGSLHSPSAFVDPKGRCIGMWNIFECLIKEDFCGTEKEVVSLPRQLSLNNISLNPLCIEPIEELKTLRFNPVKVEDVVIPANGEKILPGVQGRAMELEVVINPEQAREVGLRVLRSPDGKEQTSISLSMHAWALRHPNNRALMIDVSQASLSSEVASRTPEIGPLYLKDDEPLRLRVFIDRSIIEVFANGFARGNDAKLVSLRAYQMRSIWPEMKVKEGK